MRVFIASPFTSYLAQGVSGGVRLDAGLTELLCTLSGVLEADGHSTFVAQRREGFGAELWSPTECTPFDLLEMLLADCVVAWPERSYGVHIELGWATALGKPVILLRDPAAAPTTPLLDGLPSAARVEVISAPRDLPSSSELHRSVAEQVRDRVRNVRRRSQAPRIAMIGTSFGFGPVAKAATVSREIKQRDRSVETHYFGAGIDHEFATKTDAFDRVFRVDVDRPAQVRRLVPLLGLYQSVISFINFEVLAEWPERHPPLYLVDSLAWLWSGPPANIAKVDAYFVQRYMVPERRMQEWASAATLVPVGHICPAIAAERQASSKRTLLVSFAGCANPFTDGDLYDKYVRVLARAVMAEAAAFERVLFCTNEKLAGTLGSVLDPWPTASAAHLPHDTFLRELASADAVLMSPGITATLEAVALKRSFRFLLPQNYSQARMAEHYRARFGDESGMAFSRFHPRLAIPDDLDEGEGVRRVLSSLEEILDHHASMFQPMIASLLADQRHSGALDLMRDSAGNGDVPGQATISDYVLAAMSGGPTPG